MPRTFLVVLFIWFSLVVLVGRCQAQVHSHTNDSFERFEKTRIHPPLKITYVEPTEDGTKIEYAAYDRHQIKNGSLLITKTTHVDGKLKKGEWIWAMFCIEDNYLYAVMTVSPSQIK